MTTSVRKCMIAFAKLLHDVLGIESPKAFILIFAVFGFVVFGFVGYLVSKQYQDDLQRKKDIEQQAQPSPGPKAIDMTDAQGNVFDNIDIGAGGYGTAIDMTRAKYNTLRNVRIGEHGSEILPALKKRLTVHAGNKKKIVKDFEWARTQYEAAWKDAPQQTKTDLRSNFDIVQNQVLKDASDRTATLKLLEKISKMQR
jgi:hypothetical protein